MYGGFDRRPGRRRRRQPAAAGPRGEHPQVTNHTPSRRRPGAASARQPRHHRGDSARSAPTPPDGAAGQRRLAERRPAAPAERRRVGGARGATMRVRKLAQVAAAGGAPAGKPAGRGDAAPRGVGPCGRTRALMLGGRPRAMRDPQRLWSQDEPREGAHQQPLRRLRAAPAAPLPLPNLPEVSPSLVLHVVVPPRRWRVLRSVAAREDGRDGALCPVNPAHLACPPLPALSRGGGGRKPTVAQRAAHHRRGANDE